MVFDGRWRTTIERGLVPVGSQLRRAGVSADVLTAIGIAMAAAASVSIANGWLRVGLALLILTGLPDLLDGAVAKASGTSGPRGAYFDSVSDRLTDGLLLIGVAWYLAGTDGGRIAILPMACYVAAALVSYQRAKADALGFDARGGLIERAERFIMLAFGLLFSELLIPVLWLMLVLSFATAVQRFVKVWRQADAPRRPQRPRRPSRVRRAARPRAETWRARARTRRQP